MTLEIFLGSFDHYMRIIANASAHLYPNGGVTLDTNAIDSPIVSLAILAISVLGNNIQLCQNVFLETFSTEDLNHILPFLQVAGQFTLGFFGRVSANLNSETFDTASYQVIELLAGSLWTLSQQLNNLETLVLSS